MSGMNTGEQSEMNELPPLTDIQKETIDFILHNWSLPRNSLCALGVGLGKTRIACEIIHRLINGTEFKLDKYTLVCCSTAGTRDTIWVDTLTQYGLKPIVLSGKEFNAVKMKNKKRLTIPPRAVCLITYANLIRSEMDNETAIIEYFKNTPPSFIIFDEFHTISNSSDRNDQQYREAILELSSPFRLGLTATPLVNDENEIIIAYGLLNQPTLYKAFMEDKDKADQFIKYIRGKSFFYYKHLPYTETPSSGWLISIPMEMELYEKYNELRNTRSENELPNQQNGVLRFLVEGSFKKGNKEIICQTETGKMKALRAIVKHVNQGEKIVIFDNFTHTLDYIAKQEWIRPFHPILHHGNIAENKNRENYRRFMEEDKYRIFLTTRSQCAEGINLQVANHVIIMNCWWTAKDLIQMIGRIKRKGQIKPVYSYLLGYNIQSLLTKRPQNSDDCFLPEELVLYQTIEKKVFINELWGMNVREQLPKIEVFNNSLTFEDEFYRWLDGTIVPDSPEPAIEEEKKPAEEHSNNQENASMMNMMMAYLMRQTSPSVPVPSNVNESESPWDKDDYVDPNFFKDNNFQTPFKRKK